MSPAIDEGFPWAAWDGVICGHVGASNLGLIDTQFEAVLRGARTFSALGLLAPPTPIRSHDPDSRR